MGKSVGGGFSLGAFMAKSEIMDILAAPAHTFTLGGNAIACAAGLAQLNLLLEKESQDQIKKTAALMKECFEKLKADQTESGKIYFRPSGAGMSMGIHLLADEKGRPLSSNDAYKIIYRAYEYGLILITLGGNALRIQPELLIDEDTLRKGFEIIGQSIADWKRGDIPDSVLINKKGW
jgi:4-aminobutyrate aminotransferase